MRLSNVQDNDCILLRYHWYLRYMPWMLKNLGYSRAKSGTHYGKATLYLVILKSFVGVGDWISAFLLPVCYFYRIVFLVRMVSFFAFIRNPGNFVCFKKTCLLLQTVIKFYQADAHQNLHVENCDSANFLMRSYVFLYYRSAIAANHLIRDFGDKIPNSFLK
jgi:hypothetical protein